MVIYIHGFGSHGKGSKAKKLRKFFQKEGVCFLAPSLSYIPELAIDTLEQIVQNCSDVTLIGSSLGGYYALYLANKYNLKAVLINPAIYPYNTLKDVKEQANYFDNSTFKWTQNHIESLKKYEIKEVKQNNMMLLVQKGDKVLNYKEATIKLEKSLQIIENEGNHSFDGIEKYFDNIYDFLRKHQS